MIELPGSLREFMIQHVADELSQDADGPKKWTDAISVGLDALAEEIDEEIGENLITRLEESGELEGKLSELLADALESLTGSDPTADDLLGVLDKLCEIAWVNEEADDEIARGLLGGSDGYEEDEY